nr:hypothetical protein [Deinococcota bacterium]
PLTYVLVEEFVRTESSEYRLPNEYKVHIFNENIATIQVIRRKRRKEAIHRFYTEAWEPFDDVMNSGYPLDVFLEPPQCLDEMLRAAKTLGKAYNAFVRIDFYATDRGCVFGEFTPTPNRGVAYTDYASDYFEKLWRETYPDPNHI